MDGVVAAIMAIAHTNYLYYIDNSLLDLRWCQCKHQKPYMNEVESVVKLLVERTSDVMNGQRYVLEIRGILGIADIESVKISLSVDTVGSSGVEVL